MGSSDQGIRSGMRLLAPGSLLRWMGLLFLLGLMLMVGFAQSSQAQERGQFKLTPQLQALVEHGGKADLQDAKAQARLVGLSPKGGGSLVINAEGGVSVYLRLTDTGEATLQALRAAGAKITYVAAAYSTVVAQIQPAKLQAVASRPEVLSLEETLAPYTMSELEGLQSQAQPSQIAGNLLANTAPVSSLIRILPEIYTYYKCPGGYVGGEGLEHMKVATATQKYKVDGNGVMVGIISNSYNVADTSVTTETTDILLGDLPGPQNPCGRKTPVTVVRELSPTTAAWDSRSDEGRAMAQIIHDLAPGAQLAFATGWGDGSIYEIADSIKALSQAGAKVIADDIYFADQPFYQDDPAAVEAANFVKSGGFYAVAAGNFNRYVASKGPHKGGLTYETSAYRPSACPTGLKNSKGQALTLTGDCHNFNPNKTAPADPNFTYTMSPGQYSEVNFQWAEPWYGVKNDFDIYLFDKQGKVITPSLDPSVDPLSGKDNLTTQRPFEYIYLVNYAEESAEFNLVINRKKGTGTPPFKYIFMRPYVQQMEYTAPEDTTTASPDKFGATVFGHRGGNGVLSIAAVPYYATKDVEDFSSRGLVTNYFGPIIDKNPAAALAISETRQKPDFAATDGSGTTFFGRHPVEPDPAWRFHGTSAASPNAAAVMALLLQKAKENKVPLTQQGLELALKATATQLISAPIEAAGAGLINAELAVSKLLPGPFEIKGPTTEKPAAGGLPTSPQPLAVVLSKPVFGLGVGNFKATVGGKEATILSALETLDSYVLDVVPPAGLAAGPTAASDLVVTTVGISTTTAASTATKTKAVSFDSTAKALTGPQLHSYLDKQGYKAKDPIKVFAVPFQNNQPIKGANVLATLRSKATGTASLSTATASLSTTIQLYDDGFHGDSAAGDGLYGGTFASDKTGSPQDFIIDVGAKVSGSGSVYTQHTLKIAKETDVKGISIGQASTGPVVNVGSYTLTLTGTQNLLLGEDTVLTATVKNVTGTVATNQKVRFRLAKESDMSVLALYKRAKPLEIEVKGVRPGKATVVASLESDPKVIALLDIKVLDDPTKPPISGIKEPRTIFLPFKAGKGGLRGYEIHGEKDDPNTMVLVYLGLPDSAEFTDVMTAEFALDSDSLSPSSRRHPVISDTAKLKRADGRKVKPVGFYFTLRFLKSDGSELEGPFSQVISLTVIFKTAIWQNVKTYSDTLELVNWQQTGDSWRVLSDTCQLQTVYSANKYFIILDPNDETVIDLSKAGCGLDLRGFRRSKPSVVLAQDPATGQPSMSAYLDQTGEFAGVTAESSSSTSGNQVFLPLILR